MEGITIRDTMGEWTTRKRKIVSTAVGTTRDIELIKLKDLSITNDSLILVTKYQSISVSVF